MRHLFLFNFKFSHASNSCNTTVDGACCLSVNLLLKNITTEHNNVFFHCAITHIKKDIRAVIQTSPTYMILRAGCSKQYKLINKTKEIKQISFIRKHPGIGKIQLLSSRAVKSNQ